MINYSESKKTIFSFILFDIRAFVSVAMDHAFRRWFPFLPYSVNGPLVVALTQNGLCALQKRDEVRKHLRK